MSKHMTVKQASEYLGVSPRTIYRWIDDGRLSAVKTARGLRIKTSSAEERKNYRRRIKYYGRIFPAVVLTKYHQAPKKYRVTKKKRGLIGYLSLRTEYLKRLSLKQAAQEFFKPIRYHRVRLAGGYAIIVVRERDFARLPRAEKTWWLRFEMKPERIRQEIKK